MIVFGLNRTGWFAPETGSFTAIDGDSLRKGEREYRLHGIDAPELGQSCTRADGSSFPCGRNARDELRKLVRGEVLDCAIRETDRYGRLVADCRAGVNDINREMVRSGWAIAYRRHGTDYAADERAAREARRGIWQGEFETPERWRERHRNDMMRGDAAAVPVPAD
jgi:endonuclease YncB( thermonuclease family)